MSSMDLCTTQGTSSAHTCLCLPGIPNQLSLRGVYTCLFLFVSLQERAECSKLKKKKRPTKQTPKNPTKNLFSQSSNSPSYLLNKTKQKTLKELSWDRTTAKKTFWASPPRFPAMHLQVHAGLWDSFWLIQSFWAASNCAVLSLICGQVYLPISS